MRKGLGRYHFPDERDRKYLLREMTGTVSLDSLPTFKYWYSPVCLDQGQTPKCTAYSSKTFLMNSPIRQLAEAPTPDEIYAYAQNHDAWVGTDYDGTTVRAAMKALVYYGAVSEYRWAFTLDDAARWVALNGPLVMGTNFFEGMAYPSRGSDGRSWVSPNGQLLGGHAYSVNGINFSQRKFRIENNWGRDYGDNGFAWMSFDSLEYLLSRDGEAACAVEVSAT